MDNLLFSSLPDTHIVRPSTNSFDAGPAERVGTTIETMGIRYFAIAIDLDDYAHIKSGPCPTCGTRPHPRERDFDEPEPDTLNLDKSWHYLQGYSHRSGCAPPPSSWREKLLTRRPGGYRTKGWWRRRASRVWQRN